MGGIFFLKIINQHLILAYKTIESFITTEIKEEGLLGDVEMFLDTSIIEDPIETPLIWMEKEAITPSTTRGDYGTTQYLDMNINFVCCGEEQEEVSLAEQEAYSIALRLVSSVLKNFNKVRPYKGYDVGLVGVNLKSINPSGTFEIINKRTILPATKVEFTFEIYVDWMVAEEYDTSTGESQFIDVITKEEITK